MWAGTFVVLILIAGGVFEAMRPPTGEELVARERQRIANVCYAQSETKTFPTAMATSYCGCVVDRALGFGGADNQDLLECKQRAAKRMAGDANLSTVYAAAFPAACSAIEAYYSGRKGEENSQFCQCLGTTIGSDTGRIAMYAYAGSEPKSEARDKAYRTCGQSIAYGSGWEFGYSQQGTTAKMRLDALPGVSLLQFDCNAGQLTFAVMRSLDQRTDQQVWFVNETDQVIWASEQGDEATRLAEQLSFLDKATWNRIDLHVGDRRVAITAQGASNALSGLLRNCAGRPALPAAPTAESELPDRWDQISSGRAILHADGDTDAYLDMVCDEPPAFLEISPATVPDLSQYADPEGNFDAVGVPVTIRTVDGDFEQAVPCAPGSEGAELTCYVTLDRPLIEAFLTSPEVTVTLDGIGYPAVATAKSPALQSVGPACLRGIKG